jgi:hypothetical protein
MFRNKEQTKKDKAANDDRQGRRGRAASFLYS